MENMQANMDKRGIAKRLVQGSIHSNPEESKPEGVLQLLHNKPHSTCQQSFAPGFYRLCGLWSDGCESCWRLPIEATEKRVALPGASEPNSCDSSRIT